jgi:hypothetical protein
MTQPLAQGELLYVTNTQKIYVGNGSTLAGSLTSVTGYTDADAKDAAAASFTGGTHSGITFTYNTVTDLISANIDLSNYQGILRADAFKGSVFADDGSTIGGTLLVDAVAGIIPAAVVSGTFSGDVVGNTTGYHTGEVKGSVFADNSTLLVDAVSSTINATSITGNIFTNLIDSENSSAITVTPSILFSSAATVDDNLTVGGNATISGIITGNVIGNIQGNVLDSTGSAVIDSANSTFNGSGINFNTTNATITSPGAVFTDMPFLIFTSVEPTGNLAPVSMFVQNNAGTNTAPFGLTRVRGSILTPTSVVNGDDLGQIANIGFDGTSFISSATITAVVDNVVSTGVIPSKMEFKTSSALGVLATKATIKSTVVEFDVPPRLPVVANDTARTALVPTPTTGMMIFMSSGTTPAATNKVQVYDSTAWVNLP